ncbi:MAG TPA: DMT family transporter, partial [Thermoleophilaceae bacterium]|nr:DMT family transporter [Thermoleophilaceae bacterium]
MPVLALAATVLLWASAFAAIREAVAAFGWADLSFLRLALAALALGVVALAPGRRWRPARADLPLLGLVALSGMTLYQLLLNAGEITVDAATASLLVGTAPIFTALLAVALLGERLRPAGWAGVGLGFAGAVTIALGAGGGVSLSGGAVLVLGAALAQAVFFVAQKALLSRGAEPLGLTAWAMSLGALLTLPLAAAAGEGGPAIAAADAGALAALAFLAFGASALGFLTWAGACARIDVSLAAASLYAVPPVAALVAWLLLGELPGASTLAGGAVALTGVALTARSRRAPASDDTSRRGGRRPVRPRCRTPLC